MLFYISASGFGSPLQSPVATPDISVPDVTQTVIQHLQQQQQQQQIQVGVGYWVLVFFGVLALFLTPRCINVTNLQIISIFILKKSCTDQPNKCR